MGKLFFSADGRIGPQLFIKGAVILLALNFFLAPAGYLGGMIQFLAVIISLVAIYCWGCLFAKRFHDAGRSGWWFPLLLLMFVLVSSFLQGLLFFQMADKEIVEASLAQSEQLRDALGSGDFGAIMQVFNQDLAITQAISRAQIIPGAIAQFLTGAAMAFGINKLLKTDPNPNRWG